MRELSVNEIKEVSGGIWPLVWGIAGAYAYDRLGGRAGIDRYFRKSWASMRASVRYHFR